MYKHILMPLDNSAADAAILAHIRRLARLTGAKLTLIHVADGFVARNQKSLNLGDSPEITDDRKYLEKCRRDLASDGFEVEAVLAMGDPTDKILEAAEERGCDLIAMSTHGHRLLSDLLLGSVASEVRHRTGIPVLLVRGQANKDAKKKTPRRPTHKKKV
ncbi:MAG: universal stress protein [Planctomycetes bacterium]|nr:universal stress protein [Planctomycetota bacterium]